MRLDSLGVSGGPVLWKPMRLAPFTWISVAALLTGCGEALPPPPVIEGPACAVSDAATFASEPRRLKTSQFNDVTFRRRSGHGSCVAYQGASVCHWSAPKLLQVSHRGQDWWFAPGAGQRVVLVFAEGRPRCVIDKPQTTEEWARTHMTPLCRASPIKECP